MSAIEKAIAYAEDFGRNGERTAAAAKVELQVLREVNAQVAELKRRVAEMQQDATLKINAMAEQNGAALQRERQKWVFQNHERDRADAELLAAFTQHRDRQGTPDIYGALERWAAAKGQRWEPVGWVRLG